MRLRHGCTKGNHSHEGHALVPTVGGGGLGIKTPVCTRITPPDLSLWSAEHDERRDQALREAIDWSFIQIEMRNWTNFVENEEEHNHNSGTGGKKRNKHNHPVPHSDDGQQRDCVATLIKHMPKNHSAAIVPAPCVRCLTSPRSNASLVEFLMLK